MIVFRQDVVSNSADAADTSAGMYEMTGQTRVAPSVPVNGTCSTSLSGRSRVTSMAAQIIGNSAATAAAAAAAAAAATSGSSGGAPSSSTCGPAADGRTVAADGGAASTTTEHLSRMLDKIYETIELNELRLLIQDHKDAVKLEWQQVADISSCLL